jgi:hypothetical protein
VRRPLSWLLRIFSASLSPARGWSAGVDHHPRSQLVSTRPTMSLANRGDAAVCDGVWGISLKTQGRRDPGEAKFSRANVT